MMVLKALPKHLIYDFLGENEPKPMIISVDLNDEFEKKLIKILRQNMGHLHGR